MRERGGGAGLRAEALAGRLVGEQVRVQQLHRDRAVELLVMSQPDLGGAAAADALFEAVSVEDERGTGRIGHLIQVERSASR